MTRNLNLNQQILLAGALVAGCSVFVGGCSSSSRSSNSGSTTAPATSAGALTSGLPGVARAQAYTFAQESLATIGSRLDMLVPAAAGTESLATLSPLNTLVRLGAASATQEALLNGQGTSYSAGAALFVSTGSDSVNGSGDVLRRRDLGNGTFDWVTVLDSTSNRAVVAEVASRVVAVTGGGQAGEVLEYAPATDSFTSVGSSGDLIPYTAVTHGSEMIVGGSSSDNATLLRILGTAVETIAVPQGQRVVSLASMPTTAVGTNVLILATATFDPTTGAPISGAVLANEGTQFEVMLELSGGEVPTSLAVADQTIYVGTSGGRLLHHQMLASGSGVRHDWVPELDLPSTLGITSLLARTTSVLLIAAQDANGAVLIQRNAPGPVAPDRYFLTDVSAALARNCSACHDGSNAALGLAAQNGVAFTTLADTHADFERAVARVNTTDPDASPLLQEALGNGHAGGAILTTTSPDYAVLREWIQQGARYRTAGLAWTAVSAPATGLNTAMHVEDEGKIYAVVGNNVCLWNGTTWAPVTAATVGLQPAMHFVTESLIYAQVGSQIAKWDGAAWSAVSLQIVGLQREFHFVAENLIYAQVGTQIQKWDGTAWSALTLNVVGLLPAFHFVSETEIYAQVGTQIQRWDGTAWTALTLDAAGLQPEFQFVRPDRIFAQVGEQICLWDGAAWSQVTGNVTGLRPAFHAIDAGRIYAVVGERICSWQERPALPAAWAQLTLAAAGLDTAMHVVAADQIYAQIGEQIRKWNGVAWLPLTLVAAGLQPGFHYVAENLIYAQIGTLISKWDGTAWTPLTLDAVGLQPEFHFVAENLIYAQVGTLISKWDGTAWTPLTLDAVGLQPEFHFVAENLIYAQVGTLISKWDGTAWAPLTLDAAGLQPAFHFVSESEIVAQIGEQLCTWNGTAWVTLTANVTGLRPAFQYFAPNRIFAVVGDQVHVWQ